VPAISDFDLPSLQAQFRHWNAAPGNAQKLLRLYYESAGTLDPRSIELGKSLHARIGHDLQVRQSHVTHKHVAADGTTKLLVTFQSGGSVESVLMPSHRKDRAAGCLSSQIGCAMGCDFCASTRNGLSRNLTSGEIVEQFLHLKHEAKLLSRRLNTIVFMGMGEPMHNLDACIDAIRRIADHRLGNLGYRNITVSTVGVIAGMQKLADLDLGVYLALSLHAPDDETRSRIVPTGRKFKVADIMQAARDFQRKTGRIVTIEYCMLAGVNDSDDQAHLLGKLMEGFRAHVNLIPYNSIGAGISGAIYSRPSQERLDRFIGILSKHGVVSHFRRTRGDDVNAACGQLLDRTVDPRLPSRR
jgi:23S rRNA (adenine2503-C2)-methyltransferase